MGNTVKYGKENNNKLFEVILSVLRLFIETLISNEMFVYGSTGWLSGC